MGKLYKRGNTYYTDLYDEHGKRRREKASQHKAEALKILRERERLVELIKAGLETRQAPDITDLYHVKKLYSKYLKETMTTASLENLHAAWVNLMTDFKTIKQVNTNSMQAAILKLKDKGLLDTTINNYIARIKAMFTWICEQGYLRENPVEKLKKLKVRQKRTRRDFTQEEISKLLTYVKSDDQEWYTRFMIYAYTGLRKMAGAKLKWEWIDWNKNTITIPISNSKTNIEQTIYIHNDLRKALLEWQGSVLRVGNVFRPINSGCINQKLKDYIKKIGINPEGACVHSFRHSVATMVYKAHGLKVAQQFLGHSNPQTTLKYLHTNDDEVKQAVSALNFKIG